jgi:hypothetical protein
MQNILAEPLQHDMSQQALRAAMLTTEPQPVITHSSLQPKSHTELVAQVQPTVCTI